MITNDLKNYCLDSKTKALSWVRPVMIEKDAPECEVDELKSTTTTISSHNNGDNRFSSRYSARLLGEKLNNLNLGDTSSLGDYASGPQIDEGGHKILMKCIHGVSNSLVANTGLLNTMDSSCGDGDCGHTFAAGARGMYKMMSDGKLNGVFKLKKIMEILSETVEDSMGGTSGGIYSLLLTAISQEMGTETKPTATNETWARGLVRGMESIMRYGGAGPGSRTMLDPLHALCTFLDKESHNTDTVTLWQNAAKVVDKETKRTKNMEAKAGRAAYVRRENLIYPDPGAHAFFVALTAIVNVLVDSKKYFE
ncbi:hypothetical protein HELRODRAFT_188832 [Helobdella robusta]|uniref:DhaL domain-containing protein n=1 Tax=Helobdella robusta TaxID=6412 RepID=T1FQE5_HELRO|nr:hypothetical protein HELRODRAFT_188832 [Helobdella robusta]ESN98592.1 hypothetical protein HELRODRAFT_188832 [Helobdella robusta]